MFSIKKRYLLVIYLLIIGSVAQADNVLITFDDMISGITSYGVDSNGDGIDDIIFSTTDSEGFNPYGPGPNMSYISEPGLEGTTTLFPTDLRVDFVNGATNSISFAFALDTYLGNTYGVLFKVFAADDSLLAETYQRADFTETDFSSTTQLSNTTLTPNSTSNSTEIWSLPSLSDTNITNHSSYPEALVKVNFSGVASYATFNFDYDPSRYIIDNFALPVKVSAFSANIDEKSIQLNWLTGIEINNTGFQLWRAIKDQDGNYQLTLLREFGHSKRVIPEPHENCSIKIQGQLKTDNSLPKLISTIGNSVEGTCYSFTDTSNLSNGTYYYLLGNLDDDGNRTFHCDYIDIITVGQGPIIDARKLKSAAISYCKKAINSNN